MRIQITDGFYENESQDVNYQQCINMFPTYAGPEARTDSALIPSAGTTSLVTPGGSEVRAIIPFDDRLFAVVDATLYEIFPNFVAVSATSVSIGTMNTFAGRIVWARNTTQIFMSEGASGAMIFTPSDGTLTKVTDTDFENAETVTFMNGYFIYNVAGTGTMAATAINDGFDVNALDVATAEGSPDKLVAVVSDKRELWALGETSTEIWYDAANAIGFPFSRREGAYIDIGCAAKHSAININNTMMWLDHRRYVVQTEGYGLKVVSTPALHQEFEKYSTVKDAYAYEQLDRGHLFYVITFPGAKKTWVYDLTTQKWHQRATWDSTLVKNINYLGYVRASFQGKELIGTLDTGNICLMSRDYYDDVGTPIHRIRRTPFFSNEFNFIGIDCLEILVETGRAPVTGTGSSPTISLRYSIDGGHTWSYGQTRSLGATGEYKLPIRWNRLGTARDWIFELSLSDPLAFSIIDASIDVVSGA